jgi:dTDP-4-dehydrorhamnose reductase
MTVLIVGACGQLGRALQMTAPDELNVVAATYEALDITDSNAVATMMAATMPDIVINAAAYTAVDKAETEPEIARAVNAVAVGTLARSAAKAGARFVHVSTDFVFDGKASRAYRPEDSPAPLNVYGLTKWEGERAAVAEAPDSLIVRTSWVYASQGRNFVHTMLRVMAETDARVVADQIGTPTFAPALARTLWALIGQKAHGMYHYSDSGVASWYDFAVAIQEEAMALQLLPAARQIVPICSAEWGSAGARRPSFSVLDKVETWKALGTAAPHWRVNLREMLRTVKHRG